MNFRNGNLIPLKGHINVPGDKSISHRAIVMASQMLGKIHIRNVCSGNDMLTTVSALRAMGVSIDKISDADYCVCGVGIGGLVKPTDSFHMHNSNSSLSFISGLVTPYDFVSFFTGDASLRKRPFAAIAKPLELMGARFLCNTKDKLLPFALIGQEDTIPIHYDLPHQSAQLKTAIILAALNTKGKTTIVEQEPFARDHTEIMLENFGANIKIDQVLCRREINIVGQEDFVNPPQDIYIPGDPSSAAFLAAIAILLPGSDITIPRVCLNPKRLGFYKIVSDMGGNIDFLNESECSGERIGDIRVRSSDLVGVTVDESMFNSSIDEYPILCILAAMAKGRSLFKGVSRLKNKESNRILSVVHGLNKCGIDAEGNEEAIYVEGGAKILGGVEIDCMMDHRVAMSFLILDLLASQPIEVKDKFMLEKSYPGIVEVLDSVRD